jgi:omega-6 fatty acid desaturase (delta-12 desaturase)
MTTLLSKSASVAQLYPELRLRDILNTLPKEVFLKSPSKAWTGVVINILMVVIGYWGLALAPWYLVPFFWLFIGTGLTGFFVIGHDCGHRSFANRLWVNDLVGHTLMLPMFYPYHAWRILHNHHHKHTNKLQVDNAWDPFTSEVYEGYPGFVQWWYRRLRGWFWWVGSIAHWAALHFNWASLEGKEREQFRFSALLVLGTAAISFPVMFATLGVGGVIKFWLMPWLVYHFWMSTFTIVHHTLPDIPFTPAEEWNEAHAQLAGTVHCQYPFWVEFLCHDINVHIPHHLSTAIPSYNLRLAHRSLQENWGEYLHECRFNWELMNKIASQCHLYEADSMYQSFQEHQHRTKLNG